jgi:hypothetical protein
MEKKPKGFSGSLAVWLGIFALGLFIYLPTLHPGVGWHNSGELITAGLTLDVPHSPGYPLFTRLLSLAFRLFPQQEPVVVAHALTAILGCLAAGMLGVFLVHVNVAPILAWGAGCWLLTHSLFWEEATRCEVYTMEIFLLLLFMLICRMIRVNLEAVEEGNTGGGAAGSSVQVGPGLLFGAGLVLGLAIGHRITCVAYLPGMMLLLGRKGLQNLIRPTALSRFLFGLAVGFLPYLDLFFRLQNPERALIDPQLGAGFGGFIKFAFGIGYGKAFGTFSASELLQRTIGMLGLFVWKGGPLFLILLVLACWRAIRAKNDVSTAFLWIFGANALFVLNYNAFEADTMLLPAVTAGIGCGVTILPRRETPGRLLIAGFLLMVFCQGLTNFSNLETREPVAENWVKRMTARIPRGATLLLSKDAEFHPLWYLRLVKGIRPDISLRLIDALDADGIQTLGKDTVGGGLFGTLVYPPGLFSVLQKSFLLQPLGYVYRIHPADFVPGDRTGVSVFPLAATPEHRRIWELRGGDIIEYMLPDRPEAFFDRSFLSVAVLVDDRGRLMGQNGVALGVDVLFSEESPDGNSERNRRRYRLPRGMVIPLNILPGSYELRVLTAPRDSQTEPILFSETLSGMPSLNEDGFTEVFRLRNGFGGRPFLSAKTWEELIKCGLKWDLTQPPELLGRFSVARDNT